MAASRCLEAHATTAPDELRLLRRAGTSYPKAQGGRDVANTPTALSPPCQPLRQDPDFGLRNVCSQSANTKQGWLALGASPGSQKTTSLRSSSDVHGQPHPHMRNQCSINARPGRKPTTEDRWFHRHTPAPT